MLHLIYIQRMLFFLLMAEVICLMFREKSEEVLKYSILAQLANWLLQLESRS